MMNFHAGWYLIYTRPRHEKKVCLQLAEINVGSLLPTRKKLKTWHDRRKYVDEPLFPSYVFINVEKMEDYYAGIQAEGALYYVRTGKQIARVSDSVINNIKLLTSLENELDISDHHFLPGQRVVIGEGALTGLSCEIVQYNNKERLLVRVDLLQRNILVTLPRESLVTI